MCLPSFSCPLLFGHTGPPFYFKLSCHLLFGPLFPVLKKIYFFHLIPLFPHSRPGLSLWQVPPISLLYLPHILLPPFYRPGLSLWQVPPISFSLSLIGPACHCGRSRLSPLSIFFTFLPLSLSYRPGLSLWQVPPFLSPLFTFLTLLALSFPSLL